MSEEQLDSKQIIQDAEAFVKGVLERMDLSATITTVDEADRVVLTIDTDDVEVLTGRRGQVLDAIQHLTAKAVYKGNRARGKAIVLDAGGFRAEHVERLQALAARMAEKALAEGDEIALKPMSAYDRRIVHMAVAEIDGLETRSDGEGEDRHIVLIPTKG